MKKDTKIYKNTLNLLFKTNLLKLLPELKNEELYKGNNGKIGVIGGCEEYTGAPYYSGISALHGVKNILSKKKGL